MTQKGITPIAIILIIIGVLALGGGAWYYSKVKKSDQGIKNWSTYKNENYGFEIMYPNDYYISQETDFSKPEVKEIFLKDPFTSQSFKNELKETNFKSLKVLFESKKEGEKTVPWAKQITSSVYAVIVNQANYSNIEEWYNEEGKNFLSSSFGDFSIENIRILGKPVIKIETNKPLLFDTRVAVVNNGLIYNIDMIIYRNNEIFNQILSTFKFID